ncbi:MAG: Pilus assembly protein PilO [Thermoleophilaceae bacterium]|nr:Pilus assembly protein PilO [Thermoleophilaceae bacterium]MEA2478786.1 Pilus assembly protein PilO [Thermoleophilaceae bacterium]
MKKKLAALDPRLQLGAIGVGLLLLAVAGYLGLVSPQGAKAMTVQKEADAVQAQIYQRRAELRAGLHPPTIQTADLFRLARAMPDRTDMPGIILTLSELARSAGISFDLIEPAAGDAVPSTSYETDRIHLLFNGDFYGLSDFLYRLRSLVSVHDGRLDASGRLFNVDTLNFNVPAGGFPQISAEIFVNSYVYGSSAPAAPTAPATTDTTATTTTSASTTTSTPSTDTPPPGATAAGATP